MLASLKELVLHNNELSGPIPAELGNLVRLENLRLGENQLSGPIPPELGRLTNLTSMKLFGNQPSGPIPPELGGLTNLKSMDLAVNELSGRIPAELGGLASLEVLELSVNQLSGPIPSELGDVATLYTVILGHNKLSGPQTERYGLGLLRPRERRQPRMPNATSPLVEQGVVAFALGHPGFGPARIAAELARPQWGGIRLSHNRVWRILKRHALNTRHKRLGLVAGYAAPPEPIPPNRSPNATWRPPGPENWCNRLLPRRSALGHQGR